MTPFIDFYQFIGVSSTADEAAIRAAISATRLVCEAMVAPAQRVRRAEFLRILDDTERTLLDKDRRLGYTKRYQQHLVDLIEQRSFGPLAFHDPPYELFMGDPDPAETVAELMLRYDREWKLGIQDVLSGSLEKQLSFYRLSDQPDDLYLKLAQRVKELRESLGKNYSNEMLESLIALCLPLIERPHPTIQGHASGEIASASLVTAPDVDASFTFPVTHRGERGCLFGFIREVDPWGTIEQPPIQAIPVAATMNRGHYFSLRPGEKTTVTVQLPTTQLLQLHRPQEHLFHLSIDTQIGTDPPQSAADFAFPIQVTARPAIAIADPSSITLPKVQRGAQVQGQFLLRNRNEVEYPGSELPLNLELTSVDDDVRITPRNLPQGGAVTMMIDTRHIPFGGIYGKKATFRADGRVPALTLIASGGVLPTGWQAFFHRWSARERAGWALGGAVLGAILSPLTLIATNYAWFWILWIPLIAALGVGITYQVSGQVIQAIHESGDTHLQLTDPAMRTALGVSLGAIGVVAGILALLPQPPGLKFLAFFLLLTIMGAAYGFGVGDPLASAPPQKGKYRIGIVARMSSERQDSLKLLLLISLGAGTLLVLIALFALLWQVFVGIFSVLLLLALFSFIAEDGSPSTVTRP